MENKERSIQPQMVSMKTVCQLYDWKYDTLWKKFKRGEFVQGYRDPAGRGIRFNMKDIESWAHQTPVEIFKPSLIADEI